MQKGPKCQNEHHYGVPATFSGLGGLGECTWRLLEGTLGDLGHKLASLGRSWRQVGSFLARCCEKVVRRWAKMANLSGKSEREVVGTVGCRSTGNGRIGHSIQTRPAHRFAGAADIEDALRASTAAPSLRDLSRGTLPKKIKEKMFEKL